MQVSLVDSHCHLDRLDLTPYDGNLDALLDAARAAGVSHGLCISVDLESFPAVQKIAENHANIYASVGVHPLYRESQEPDEEELVALAAHPKVVGIGETGLDYFYAPDDNQWQQQRFIAHIKAAKRTGLPLIVHTRGAREDTLELIETHGEGRVKGVLHCFTEDWAMAEAAIAMGFYISISGIVTFKNAENVREVARRVPRERLLIETDAPWLAPVPYRGKKNEPRYIVETARCVADLQKVSVDELAQITANNFFTLFAKAASTTAGMTAGREG